MNGWMEEAVLYQLQHGILQRFTDTKVGASQYYTAVEMFKKKKKNRDHIVHVYYNKVLFSDLTIYRRLW